MKILLGPKIYSTVDGGKKIEGMRRKRKMGDFNGGIYKHARTRLNANVCQPERE